MERKTYASLDILKLLMALGIMISHIANEWAHTTGIWHYILSCDYAVPTFFAISGFLFFVKYLGMDSREERLAYYKKWTGRVLKMYLVWTLVYFCFIVTHWITNGTTITTVLTYLWRSIVFQSYSTIWFLPALWMGVTICFLCIEYGKKWCVFGVVGALYLIGLLGGPYFILFRNCDACVALNEWYNQWFFTWRNGTFYADAYILIGYLIALEVKNAGKPRISFAKSFIMVVLTQMLFVGEALMLKHYDAPACMDMALMMLPSVYFIVEFALNIDIPNYSIWKRFRNWSILIFCGQRLFLSAIPGKLPDSVIGQIQAMPQLEIFAIFVISTLLFAVIIEALSNKWRWLKVIM